MKKVVEAEKKHNELLKEKQKAELEEMKKHPERKPEPTEDQKAELKKKGFDPKITRDIN